MKKNDVITEPMYWLYDGFYVQYCGGSYLLYDANGNHIKDFDSLRSLEIYTIEHPAKREDKRWM